MEYEELMNKINKLSISEKILLVEDIWDSIALGNEDIPLTIEQKKELDRRYESFLKNPGDLKSWDEVKNIIQSKL